MRRFCYTKVLRTHKNRKAFQKGSILKKKILITLILVLILAGLGVGGYFLFKHYDAQTTFLDKTTVDGEEIGGKTPEELAKEFASRLDTTKTKVELSENGETAVSATLDKAGWSCDETEVKAFFVRAYHSQKSNIFRLIKSLVAGTELNFKEVYTFDEKTFTDFAASGNFKVPREETVDWHIEMVPPETGEYEVVGGTKGNIIDDEALRTFVKGQITETLEAGALPKEISIDVPADVYTSVDPVGDVPALEKERDEKNHELRKQRALDAFKASSITYVFGEEKQVLDFNTFGSWLTVNDQYEVYIDDSAAEQYVVGLKQKYDTQYHERAFSTSTGITHVFSEGENEYGYRINQQEELKQLFADLRSFKAVEREPVYVSTNEYGNPYYLARNGVDDLCGTYVEVNLTRQHLWFYKNGQLIVQSDIVSGRVSDGKETKTGVLPLAFKQSPRVLTGDEAGGSGSYSTYVEYWMPFFDGQGLHDAPWRGEFGGNIYVEDGSHGCVNLPPSVARTIYENIEVGTAIIIYKE